MKPPVVHQPVQPPVPAPDARQARIEPTAGREPGLVGSDGPLVATSVPERDGAADDERQA